MGHGLGRGPGSHGQQQQQQPTGQQPTGRPQMGGPATVGPAAVRVEFKRGRVELFRVDDALLARHCAAFQGPYHMWVECSPGEDVGLVVQQVKESSQHARWRPQTGERGAAAP
jgi:hypothetical protein